MGRVASLPARMDLRALRDWPRRMIKDAPVRIKLLIVAVVPFLTLLPILLFLIFYWGVAYYDRLLTFKVSSDLAVAHQYFIHVVDRVGLDVAALGASHALTAAVPGKDADQLHELLAARQSELKLDFLDLLDVRGGLIASSRALRGESQARSDWPVVSKALNGESATAIDLYSEEQLRHIGSDVAAQAHLELVDTPSAAPVSRTAETRGMMVHTAAPVFNEQGKLVAVIEGGMLLNQNLDFVDTINALVYTQGSLPAGSEGTATLFIDDVRIATNVRLFGDKRALGTRASQVVRDHVLGQGKTWLDRAFVVHDWYISAYEPVTDSYGKRVGMLYVGYLETPFRVAKETAIGLVVLLFALICGSGVFVSLRVAREIYRPVESMNGTMSRVESGDLGARTGGVATRDELGNLSRHLDELLATVQKQNQELKDWGDELDRKVIERTAEVERANKLLVEAQRQLAMADKLAAIGEMTAGVAHEINNPVAVIQGNLDVLRETLGRQALPVQHELRLIDQQIQRINTIVTKLLQFASPGEFAGYVEPVSVDDSVADSLVLLRHLLAQSGVRVSHARGATRTVRINQSELQQVIINLCTNAVHAMPGGGELRIESRDWTSEQGLDGVALCIADNGVGIRNEDLPRVFDAFFTTKRHGGTGLGLSISYTLVARYGGSIAVESELGVGTTFTVYLLE